MRGLLVRVVVRAEVSVLLRHSSQGAWMMFGPALRDVAVEPSDIKFLL